MRIDDPYIKGDYRRTSGCAVNSVNNTIDSSKSISLVIPGFNIKFIGFSQRVSVPTETMPYDSLETFLNNGIIIYKISYYKY